MKKILMTTVLVMAMATNVFAIVTPHAIIPEPVLETPDYNEVDEDMEEMEELFKSLPKELIEKMLELLKKAEKDTEKSVESGDN